MGTTNRKVLILRTGTETEKLQALVTGNKNEVILTLLND